MQVQCNILKLIKASKTPGLIIHGGGERGFQDPQSFVMPSGCITRILYIILQKKGSGFHTMKPFHVKVVQAMDGSMRE